MPPGGGSGTAAAPGALPSAYLERGPFGMAAVSADLAARQLYGAPPAGGRHGGHFSWPPPRGVMLSRDPRELAGGGQGERARPPPPEDAVRVAFVRGGATPTPPPPPHAAAAGGEAAGGEAGGGAGAAQPGSRKRGREGGEEEEGAGRGKAAAASPVRVALQAAAGAVRLRVDVSPSARFAGAPPADLAGGEGVASKADGRAARQPRSGRRTPLV